MKALTLHQYWATLMALLLKKIETRGWYTSYRGEIAIHAAAVVPKEALYSFVDTPEAARALQPLGIKKPSQLKELPLGVIVGVADLVGCIPTNDAHSADRITGRVFQPPHTLSDEYAFGNYGVNRYMWFTENLRPLSVPVPVRGYQRIWNVPADIEARVRVQFESDSGLSVTQSGKGAI